jgi:hypothetical protein
MEVRDQLLRVCALLNEHGTRYLIVGGHACILHGHVRTTEDVDILVEDAIENFQRVIAGLSALEDHAAAELTSAPFSKSTSFQLRWLSVEYGACGRNHRRGKREQARPLRCGFVSLSTPLENGTFSLCD